MELKLLPHKKIIIYGAGMVGNLVRQYLELQGLAQNIEAFAVTDCIDEGQLHGYRYIGIEALKEFSGTCQVIIATFPGPQKSMEENLTRLGFKNIIKVDFEMYHAMAECYIQNFIANKELVDEYDVLNISSDNNSSSGAFLCLIDLVVEANRQGIRALVVLPEYGSGEELLIENKIDYTYVPSKTWLKRVDHKELTWQEMEEHDNGQAVERLEEIIEECNIKLIHSNTTYTNVGAIAANKKNIPVIWHLRERISEQGYGYDDENYFYNMLNSANIIITVTDNLKEHYTKLDEQKVITVYDGIDVNRYFAKHCIMNNEHVKILMPGTLYSLKRQEDLVKAAIKLKKRNIDFYIYFIGAGEAEYIAKIQKKIIQNDLTDRFKFIGRVNNIETYYKNADIVISCSGVESFGRVCVEGMLAGCLVVGANSGGTIEIIKDKETGLLFEYKNVDNLAETLMYAISNIEEVRQLAANGQKYAKDHFGKEFCTKNIFDIYSELMEEK